MPEPPPPKPRLRRKLSRRELEKIGQCFMDKAQHVDGKDTKEAYSCVQCVCSSAESVHTRRWRGCLPRVEMSRRLRGKPFAKAKIGGRPKGSISTLSDEELVKKWNIYCSDLQMVCEGHGSFQNPDDFTFQGSQQE